MTAVGMTDHAQPMTGALCSEAFARLIGRARARTLHATTAKLIASPPSRTGFCKRSVLRERWRQPQLDIERANFAKAGRISISHSSASASNKPQEVFISQQTYQYLLAHTAESQALASLRERTAAQWPGAKGMQVSPDQGRYLSWLAGSIGAKTAIEVGVFTGYSAICLAQAIDPSGYLLACESDPHPLELAQKAFVEAGVAHKINLQIGKAQATLQTLLDNSYHDTFDLAFVDADKRAYWQYHEMLLKLVRRGGVLVYDNMLWYGAVVDPEDTRKSTAALRTFSKQLLNDPRVDVCVVPIGDGMALCRRL